MLGLGVFSPIPVLEITIDSIDPSTVADGVLATIEGLFGFQSGYDIDINSVIQQVNDYGFTDIEIQIEAGTLEPGNYTLTVVTPYGFDDTITVGLSVEVVSDTILQSVSPEIIEQEGSLTLLGINFYATQGTVQLIQGDTTIEQSISSWSGNEIDVTVDVTGFIGGYLIEAQVTTFNGQKSNRMQVNLEGTQGVTSHSGVLTDTIDKIPYIEDIKRKKPKYITQ